MTTAKNPAENWETAYEGSNNTLVFDTPGDQFTGWYEGPITVHNDKTGEDYEYALFRGVTDKEGYQISMSYSLRKGLVNVPEGALARLTFLKEIDTSNGKQAPLKDIKVEYQPV